MKKIFVVTILCMFLLVGTVSAFEVIDFDKKIGEYGQIVIEDRKWYDPFGWVFEKNLVEKTLVTHTERCLIDCYSEGTSILHEDMALFEEFEFWRGHNNNREDKINSKFKIFIKEDVTVNYQSEITTDITLGNGTIIKQVIGYNEKNYTSEQWVIYDYRVLPAGTYYWRLEVKKDAYVDLDWVGTVRGKKLEEWAWFDAFDGTFEIFNTTGADTFTVPAGVTNVSVLVVGGGGAGGGAEQNVGGGGGGGAGGFIFNGSFPVTPLDVIQIYVGDGGAGINGPFSGNNGSNSTFGSSIAFGGGGGGTGSGPSSGRGIDGASGGGNGLKGGGGGGGGSAVFGSQGNDGGPHSASPREGGGGGGASVAGIVGTGGNGSTVFAQTFAGGGGGGGETGQGGPGIGGTGGGGDGAIGANDGFNGTEGYGGGGGAAGVFSSGGALTTGGWGGHGIVIVRFFDVDIPTVTISNPINNSNLTSSIVTFAGIASDAINLVNVSLYINGVLNQTNSTPVNGSQTNFTVTIPDGITDWFYGVFNNASQGTNSTGFRFDLNSTILTPDITIHFPINGSVINGTRPTQLNYSNSSTGNFCWFSTDGGTTNSTPPIICGSSNFTIAASETTTGSNTWTIFANNTDGNERVTTTTFTFNVFGDNGATFNASSFETAIENFIINITTNGTTPGNVQFTYDGVRFDGVTVTNTNANFFDLSRSITIPIDVATNNWNFNFTTGSSTVNVVSTRSQIINLTSFTLCSVIPQNIPYINLSFRNETLSEESVNGTIDSTWFYSLSPLSGINKTLVFSDATENFNYTFCLTPGDRDLIIDVDISYNNLISQQRQFSLTRVLTNLTTNQVLYLLPTTLGIFAQFATVDTLGRVIPAVSATITRVLNAVTITIGIGNTDGSGFISFFTNPDVLYTGSFAKAGFTTEVFTFTPNNNIRTVTLASAILTPTNGTEISLNTTYTITPSNTTLLNNTNVTFVFNVTSDQDIIFISLNITNETGTQILFVSGTSAGAISGILNTTIDTKLIGTFIINTSTESITVVRIWIISNVFAGAYSLFTQLVLFNTYGFSDFFRLLMVFLVIVGTMIFITAREVVESSESKVIITALLVWAFSLVGWLDTGLVVNNPSDNVNTIAQFSSQFGIAIVTTMGAFFFIARRIFIRRI